MLVTLAFISAFPPLSTDLYLPALPQMAQIFATTPARINLTLSLFFVFFAAGILVWGPLSDKYGRKPVLYCGLSIYILSSLLCSLAGDYLHLVLFRVFQGFGGGAATAVATAVVKDVYSGEKRARVLAIIMAMVITSPVVAPLIGALLLKFASWRAMFVTLAGFGVFAAVMASPLSETLVYRYKGSPLRSLGRLFVVLKNPGFSLLLFIFSSVTIPMMAFVVASSYVYISGFGMSEQLFSAFFAANAVAALAGPIFYIRIARYFHSNIIITVCFGVMAVSGVLVAALGQFSPFVFAATMMPATMAITSMRPPCANLLLEQQDRDTGSASSLINFFGTIMGSVGMTLISLSTEHLVFYIGMMQVITGGLGLLAWLAVKNRPFVVQGA